MAKKESTLDLRALENWLWDAACKVRGPLDPTEYKDYILPLVFLKRLSDVFDDESAKLAEDFGNLNEARTIVEDDRDLVRFYIPENARWANIAKKRAGIGEYLTDAVRDVAKENPRLQGVIDVVDFNATKAGQRMLEDDVLITLVGVLGKHRLGIDDVEPDILGRAYEYLLRQFAEGRGQKAGEDFTPPYVARLMAYLLDPEEGQEVYDPCCGSGGLLIKCQLRLRDKKGDRAFLKVFGQDIKAPAYAIAQMNHVIHDLEAELRIGNTMTRPAFTNPDSSLRQFDLVAANPMWNQDFPVSTYENDPYERFGLGVPPGSSADWGWLQHMLASLKDGGKLAVVIDTGAVSRGSGTQGANRERDIRKKFVEDDLIEAVYLLPENLFYNTSAPGVVIVINKAKKNPGEILLVNGSKMFEKGRPKNEMSDEHIETLAGLYHEWKEEEGLSAIIKNEKAVRNDYNLSPSRYVASNDQEKVLSPEDAVVLLREAEEERVEADAELENVLNELGLVDTSVG